MRNTFFLLSFLLCPLLPSAVAGSPADWHDWQHGMSGYQAAWDAAEADKRPLIVYFQAEWCGWCRRLNEKYLTADEVKAFLEPLERVEINPEKDPEGQQLFTDYGSTVYPGFYVVLPGSGRDPVRLAPFRGGDEIPVEDFIGMIQREVNTKYHNWAYELMVQRDFEQGLEVTSAALEFDEEYDGLHGLRGRMLHQQAEIRLDMEMLDQAREAYREALRANPADDTSRHWLNAISE